MKNCNSIRKSNMDTWH